MQSKQLTWQFAWDYPAFRIKLFLGIFIMGLILFYLEDFFIFIQARNGVGINDRLLDLIPAYDVSTYIFLILYPASALVLWKIRGNSNLCITFLWGYIFMCLARMVTITLIPLDPPKQIIHLEDPFSIIFYGTHVITKDLFFSGHTASLFLVGLCLEKKRDKILVFTATAVLAGLLLIQHVHYTADVIAAPFFSYLFWRLGKTISKI
jgi:hypothetical protein